MTRTEAFSAKAAATPVRIKVRPEATYTIKDVEVVRLPQNQSTTVITLDTDETWNCNALEIAR
jgi:hypothetical protein